jgi:hypothetical protein
VSSSLPRREHLEEVGFSIEGSDACGSEYLVTGKNEEVSIESLHVDREVRGRLGSVNQNMDTVCMGDLDDFLDRIDGSE